MVTTGRPKLDNYLIIKVNTACTDRRKVSVVPTVFYEQKGLRSSYYTELRVHRKAYNEYL